MIFRINEIGLFQNAKKDIIKFNDTINFISGESKTGKSSIGEIINYCLASSKQTVRTGRIINEIDIFSILLTLDNQNILIARNRYDSENYDGKKYIFLKNVDNNFSFDNIEIDFFEENISMYLKINDFLELEITKYFSSFPPKTRLDGKEMVRPTIRNMPPFMFQVQDIIKHASHLFYQMDRGTKTKGIKRDFELFLGLVEFTLYNKINRKNEIIKELKKIENSKNLYEDEIKKEYFNLRSSYHRLFTHLNKNIDVDSLTDEYIINIENLNGLNLEYKIDSDIGKYIEKLTVQANKQSKKVEDIKIEYSNIRSHIQHIDIASINLQINENISYTKNCPFCNTEVLTVFTNFEKAKKKILDEKNFLNNYNSDILREKEIEIKTKLDTEKEVLNVYISEIQKLKVDMVEVKTIEEKKELLYEIKGMIKNNITTIQKYEKNLLSDERKEALEKELEKLEKELKKVDMKKKRQEAELLIGNYATEMLLKLPFDKSDYGKPNLKFDIKDVTAYQQSEDNIYYLSEIGSGENHLSFHLAVFLGLHKYILKHEKSILPSFIFLDQPSQVYFPKEEEFKKGTGDIKKVENMYKAIIQFIEDINNSSLMSDIQVIIVDHYYSDEKWYQNYLVEPRWEKDKGLALIKDIRGV